jgi:peptide/nickel transport system substrate-binding protein
MKGIKKAVAFAMAMALTLGAFTGCSGSKKEPTNASADGKKTFTFGDTTFNAENEEATIDPHEAYCGWACIRYGVGETLFKFNDNMELEPWVAKAMRI